jgi:uncharacterized protein (TIGR02145 family)
VWQSSNEFAVTVFNCSFTAGTATSATATFVDPRDGKSYKTVVMPDGKTWFAQNLNYTKDLTYNAYAYEANGVPIISKTNGISGIGSYWCPAQYWVNGAELVPVTSGSEAACNTYGALYTWETAMMVDGKYADETKTSSAWDESWVSPYYFDTGSPSSNPNADKNNARGTTSAKDGGRGICPMGWHVPTILEWAAMVDKVEGDGTGSVYSDQATQGKIGENAGLKLRSACTFSISGSDPGDGCWRGDCLKGDNSTFFSALPAGFARGNGETVIHRGFSSVWWSSCLNDAVLAPSPQVLCEYPGWQRLHVSRSYGLSLRCIKD